MMSYLQHYTSLQCSQSCTHFGLKTDITNRAHPVLCLLWRHAEKVFSYDVMYDITTYHPLSFSLYCTVHTPPILSICLYCTHPSYTLYLSVLYTPLPYSLSVCTVHTPPILSPSVVLDCVEIWPGCHKIRHFSQLKYTFAITLWPSTINIIDKSQRLTLCERHHDLLNMVNNITRLV